MICRIWHGWTSPEAADAYERLLRDQVFTEIRARAVRGFAGIELLRREAGPETEFVTLMWFDTLEAVREFAGTDVERAVVPPQARTLLARFDHRSAHFTVREPGPAHDVTLRPLRPDDFAAWQVLWDGYNAFYGRSGSTALSPDITRTTWARLLDATEPVHGLVAERAGELVGLVHYLFHRSTTRIELTCYLQDLFTAEHAREGGVGRALIAAVGERARDAGVDRVYWQTHETNTGAMALYDRLAKRSGFLVYHMPT